MPLWACVCLLCMCRRPALLRATSDPQQAAKLEVMGKEEKLMQVGGWAGLLAWLAPVSRAIRTVFLLLHSASAFRCCIYHAGATLN